MTQNVTLQSNLHQLVLGYLEQSLEEVKEGFCTEIEITLLPEGYVQIWDNGRGLPLSTDLVVSKDVLEKILAGNPITNAEYSQLGDLKGADLQTMNSLCEVLNICVTREGNHYQQDYIRGIAQHELLRSESNEKAGTLICLKPDSMIFGDAQFEEKLFVEWGKQNQAIYENLSVKIYNRG